MMISKAVLLAISLLTLSSASAHDGVMNKDVMARMNVMSSMGSDMRLIGQMIRKPDSFDLNAAQAVFQNLAQRAAETPAVFKVEANDPKSEAKPLIWAQFPQFIELSKALETAATEASGSLQTHADLRPALGTVGRTCKACHSVYRQ
jgi:cytochrome c556